MAKAATPASQNTTGNGTKDDTHTPETAETRTFALKTSVFLGGRHYAPPGKIALDRATFDELKPLGAIEGEWK